MGNKMTKTQHLTEMVYLLQDVLAGKNARQTAQKKLYEYRAILLNKKYKGANNG